MRILDLFCCAGGAGKGYADAGFDVYGVDLDAQPNYPFPFVQADAITVLSQLLRGSGIAWGDEVLSLEDFDAIHASPPCQRYSPMTRRHGDARVDLWPDLIRPVRQLLEAIGLPYVIENVVGAAKELRDPVMLCGDMFQLGTEYQGRWHGLRRHRLFETNWSLAVPEHHRHEGPTVGVYGNPGGTSKRDGLSFPQLANWREAMEIDWTSKRELAESIPPAYTRHIGAQLAAEISKEEAA